MPTRSIDDQLGRAGRARAVKNAARRRDMHTRMPSTTGYLVVAVLIAVVLFVALWWLLREGGDEAPWLLSGLAAGVVILVAVAAREVVMRRAWARYTYEQEMEMRGNGGDGIRPSKLHKLPGRQTSAGVQASATALRALQQRLADAEATGADAPEAHLEAYRLCEQYLTDADDAMRSHGASPDVRVALHAGQERVRALQKHHLLAWARGEATHLTHEAQRRVRLSDKIETAQRAIDVIDEALRIYPGEPELRASATAVRDFVATVKVAHWVELAERAVFRGKYGRGIARYRDALFYLSRAEMGEDARASAATRINREIELLRARIATSEKTVSPSATPEYARASQNGSHDEDGVWNSSRTSSTDTAAADLIIDTDG